MPETRIYRGWITEDDMGDAIDVLFLTGERGHREHMVDEPLAELVHDDMDSHGNYLSVRYHITDQERTAEELENSLAHLAGVGEAEFSHAYSEITGYLWTNEWIRVGGHDLLDELGTHVGKFCHLEITYAKQDKFYAGRSGRKIHAAKGRAGDFVTLYCGMGGKLGGGFIFPADPGADVTCGLCRRAMRLQPQ